MTAILARHYTKGRTRRPRLIVIHTMESGEGRGTARSIAEWFAGSNAPQASAHVCIDATETITCVYDGDTAWAAPGANADGLQIEHAGRAGQTAAQWADDYSQAVLKRSAAVAARWAAAYGIPALHLTDSQIAGGAAGIVGHDQVSRVYKKSTHWDPGPHFPWADYLAMVAAARPGTTKPTPTTEDDMPLSDADVQKVVHGLLNAKFGREDRLISFGQMYSSIYADSKNTAQAIPVLAEQIAAAVVARIPAGTVGGLTAADVRAAVVDVLRSVPN